MSGFQCAITIGSSIRLNADGGVGFHVTSQELPIEQKIEIAKYQGAFGFMMFKERQEELKEEDIKEDEFGYKKKKKHVQLRDRCYYVAKARLRREPLPEEVQKVYEAYMDEIIEKVEDKLEELQ
jgi:hypothetical protein